MEVGCSKGTNLDCDYCSCSAIASLRRHVTVFIAKPAQSEQRLFLAMPDSTNGPPPLVVRGVGFLAAQCGTESWGIDPWIYNDPVEADYLSTCCILYSLLPSLFQLSIRGCAPLLSRLCLGLLVMHKLNPRFSLKKVYLWAMQNMEPDITTARGVHLTPFQAWSTWYGPPPSYHVMVMLMSSCVGGSVFSKESNPRDHSNGLWEGTCKTWNWT